MRICFVYPPGRISRLIDARDGRAPAEFFFGGIEAESFAAIEHLEVKTPKKRLSGSTLLHRFIVARRLARNIESDCIVLIDEHLAPVLRLYLYLAGRATPIVSIRCRGAQIRHVSKLFKPLLLKLVRNTTSVFLSEDEATLLASEYSLSPETVFVSPFGVDTDFWTSTDCEENIIVTVGDSGRDYATLLSAASQIDAPIHGVTAKLAQREIPSSLKTKITAVEGGYREKLVSDADLRTLYQRAACVVVPLIDADTSPVGQSVCLQAMSCGKPVVMTRTRSNWSQALRDGENILFVPPYDADALAAAVNKLMAEPALRERIGLAARNVVEREFTIKGFSSNVLNACQAAVAMIDRGAPRFRRAAHDPKNGVGERQLSDD